MRAAWIGGVLLLGSLICAAQPESPAAQILARHQQVLEQKKAISDRIAAERAQSGELIEAYRQTKSKNLPPEALVELVNQGVTTTPPEKFPTIVTPPITPQERQILESEKTPEGVSYLKLVEEVDKRFPDPEFVAFCESSQIMLRRNRWLRGKLGKL